MKRLHIDRLFYDHSSRKGFESISINVKPEVVINSNGNLLPCELIDGMNKQRSEIALVFESLGYKMDNDSLERKISSDRYIQDEFKMKKMPEKENLLKSLKNSLSSNRTICREDTFNLGYTLSENSKINITFYEFLLNEPDKEIQRLYFGLMNLTQQTFSESALRIHHQIELINQSQNSINTPVNNYFPLNLN